MDLDEESLPKAAPRLLPAPDRGLGPADGWSRVTVTPAAAAKPALPPAKKEKKPRWFESNPASILAKFSPPRGLRPPLPVLPAHHHHANPALARSHSQEDEAKALHRSHVTLISTDSESDAAPRRPATSACPPRPTTTTNSPVPSRPSSPASRPLPLPPAPLPIAALVNS